MGHNILVTGGAGYLGSIMVPKLLEKGHKVTVLDNFMYNQSSLLECCAHDHFEVIKGDARDRDTIKHATKKADIIIPLAAIVGAPRSKLDKLATESINRDAIATLIDVTSTQQKILVPTTNSGYGVGEEGVHCTEESPLKPLSLYGTTKVEAEKMILDRGESISFRLATVFGMSPRMRIDLLVNDFAYRAITDSALVLFEGHFKRNYIHIRDVTRAFLHGIENFDSMKNEVYNVGLSDANLSKLELCQKIKEYVPNFFYHEAEIGEDPDKRNYIVSNDKIESTGFKPEYSLDFGLKELIKGYTIITNYIYGNL